MSGSAVKITQGSSVGLGRSYDFPGTPNLFRRIQKGRVRRAEGEGATALARKLTKVM